MKSSKVLAIVCLVAMFQISASVKADLTISVSANTNSGGTNWSFSGGTGTVSGAGNHFLVGETAANPQPFVAVNDDHLDGFAVLAGSNTFNIRNIFARDYGGLSGTNGSIFDGLDFQTTAPITGMPISSLNGLVLHASQIEYSSLNEGVYTLDSYYSGYNTELGVITLIVGEGSPVEEATPKSIPSLSFWGLAVLAVLLGFVGMRRRLA